LDYNDFKKRPQLKDMAFIKNPMGGTLFPLTLGEYTFLNKLIDQRQNGEGDFASHQDDKEIPAQDTLKECINLLQSNGNLVLTGAPGTGKTYLAKQIVIHWMFNKKNEDELTDDERKIFREHYDFVQLHPSYDYTDFVEGLRPTREDVGFKLEDGIFKKFCKRAAVQDELPYIFVIDEINRGEISKIFGELFFSIDPDYRGEKGKVKTQYSNLIEDDDPFKDGFYIPNNVYIIGTMNDIDRSVESFDFAMRRRFVWKEVTAEESAVNMQLKEDVSEEACNKMKSLNDEISKIEELGGHYQIGAAYFLKLKDIDNDYRRLWTLHLKPLLWEYVRALPEPQKVLDRLEQAYNLENTTNENSA
jgi:5-methylcytosine-specific restriction endonuclease McrBC GTP-binding regulatory subunit McrB